MNSHLPIDRADNGTRPYYGRRHSARYYAHRVKESLTTRVSKFICTIFLFILFVVGLIVFILWISLRPHRPRFHIEEFSIPALAQPDGAPESASIHFNITIRNPNHKVTIHFESIDSSIFYKDQSIGNSALSTEAFDQDSKSTRVIDKVLSGSSLTVTDDRWTSMQGDRKAGSVQFRLQINSVIKFEIFSWDTKWHKMHANCVVMVGSDGLLLPAYKDKRCPVYFT